MALVSPMRAMSPEKDARRIQQEEVDSFCDNVIAAARRGDATFNFTHNYVLRAIPQEIKLLKPTLQILHINSCFELTTLPSAIGELTGLRWLNVSYNRLEELPPEIARLRNLERLHVNNNRLRSLPIEVWALKCLQELHCDSNSIQAIPTGILFLHELRELFVDNNPLVAESDAAEAEIAEVLPRIQYGDCSNCNIRFRQYIAMLSFHPRCGAPCVPFGHYVCSERCERQLRQRLFDFTKAPCKSLCSGSGRTFKSREEAFRDAPSPKSEAKSPTGASVL